MDSVARKKQIQREEEEERQYVRKLESFKAAKRRPKRASHQDDQPHQPAAKRARMITNNHEHEEDLDLGGWLRHAEARCLRVGNLKARLELDRDRVLKIMARMKEDQPVVVVQHQLAGTEDTHVFELDQEKPVVVAQHTRRSEAEYERACVRKNITTYEHKKRAVPNPEYKLTSFAAWWRRVEKEERKF